MRDEPPAVSAIRMSLSTVYSGIQLHPALAAKVRNAVAKLNAFKRFDSSPRVYRVKRSQVLRHGWPPPPPAGAPAAAAGTAPPLPSSMPANSLDNPVYAGSPQDGAETELLHPSGAGVVHSQPGSRCGSVLLLAQCTACAAARVAPLLALPCSVPAADDYAERLKYSPGGASGRFVPLGNLTIGGTETSTVCLCTDRTSPPGDADTEA